MILNAFSLHLWLANFHFEYLLLPSKSINTMDYVMDISVLTRRVSRTARRLNPPITWLCAILALLVGCVTNIYTRTSPTETLEKSTKDSVTTRFFAQTSLMIRRIVRIGNVVDRFLRKSFDSFSKNFLNFKFDRVEKQSIINLSSCRCKSYASVVLDDFEITFHKDATFCPPLYFLQGVSK